MRCVETGDGETEIRRQPFFHCRFDRLTDSRRKKLKMKTLFTNIL